MGSKSSQGMIKIFQKWVYLERKIFLKTNVKIKQVDKFLFYILRYNYLKPLYKNNVLIMFSFLSLTNMGLKKRKRKRKHASFKDPPEKNLLIIKRQKGRRQAGSMTQQNYFILHLFSTISY